MILENVRILLDWTYDAKHAIIVEARDRGAFRKAGIELEILEPASKSAMAIERLHSGDAELAINYPHNILLLQNSCPGIISVGSLVGSNPEGLLSLKEAGIEKPEDIKGKRVGVGPSPVSLGQFEIFLKANSIDTESVEHIKVGFEGEDLLIKGEIEALDAVSYAIPRTINKGHEVNFIAYTANGLPDSPFLVFAAAESWALDNRDLLQGFFAALAEGLAAVEAWGLADWERYTEKLPDRNAAEEFAVWKRIQPAISNGKPFQLDHDGLKILMNDLRLKGLLDCDYDLERFFPNTYL